MNIVIPSCYAYRQCWEPWIAFQKHWWPACPYKNVLISNGAFKSGGSESSFDRVISYEDRGFCGNLLHWCKFYTDDTFVIFILDDHWICGAVDNHYLDAASNIMQHNSDVGCFRLHPSPGPTSELPGSDLCFYGIADQHTPYRISTAPSIWHVSYLIKLLELLEREKPEDKQYGFKPGTAGYFEIMGSLMSMTFPETILTSSVPVIPFINSAIVHGQWNRNAVEEARKIGVEVDTSGRPFRSYS